MKFNNCELNCFYRFSGFREITLRKNTLFVFLSFECTNHECSPWRIGSRCDTLSLQSKILGRVLQMSKLFNRMSLCKVPHHTRRSSKQSYCRAVNSMNSSKQQWTWRKQLLILIDTCWSIWLLKVPL